VREEPDDDRQLKRWEDPYCVRACESDGCRQNVWTSASFTEHYGSLGEMIKEYIISRWKPSQEKELDTVQELGVHYMYYNRGF
jgi:hypothetical protein